MGDSSDPDLDISNGTCYYGANADAVADYIPCGNEAAGTWTCCMNGDICLGDQACYHSDYDITYVAGCTDPDYSSPECPYKGKFTSQQWVGLVRCDDEDDSIWAGCKESGRIPGRGSPAKCTCAEDTQLFTDKPKLDNIASLPAILGGTISWYPGMSPTFMTETTETPLVTDAPMSTSTSVSDPPSTVDPTLDPTSTSISSSTSNQSSTPTPTIPPSNSSPIILPSNEPDSSTATTTPGPTLSTAAQAGIGVGACVGFIFIGCLLYLALYLRKRRDRKLVESTFTIIQPGAPSNGNNNTASSPHTYLSSPPSATAPTTAAYYGYKSGLAADDQPATIGSLNNNNDRIASVKMEGSTPSALSIPQTGSRSPSFSVSVSASGPNSPTTGIPTSPSQQFRAYNPLLHGNYAENREAISPISTRSGSGPIKAESRLGEGAAPPTVIHELEG